MAVTVTACLIVKNEAKVIRRCLDSVRGLVNTVVIVDTGSTDRTKELARGFGARIFEFPWVDSFAAARNESLRHATSQWCFWLDADDKLDENNRQKLRRLIGTLGDENVAHMMRCMCQPGAAGGLVDDVGASAEKLLGVGVAGIDAVPVAHVFGGKHFKRRVSRPGAGHVAGVKFLD